MNEIKYLSTLQLLEKTREKIIDLPTQARAREELGTLFSLHMNNIKAIENGVSPDELVSLNSFVIAGTGCGKSHMTQNLAKACGLNFARIDCANITPAAYKGRNLSNALSGIISDNPNFFDDGCIILLDEIDKVGTVHDGDGSVTVAKDFLVLLEGGQYTFNGDDKKDITIDLSKCLFLLCGACSKLQAELEKKYKKKNSLGFSTGSNETQTEEVDVLSKVTLQDLTFYFMPEIVGRLRQLIYIPQIDIDGYKMLVNDSAKTSAINKYQHIFETRGVKFKITNSARDLIAEKALKEGLGARSIEGVLNKIIVDAHNHVDRTPECNKVVLTANKNGEFKLNYYNGARIQKKVASEKLVTVTDADLDINIKEELENRLLLHIFCRDICDFASPPNKFHEAVLFSFLHTVCYYLAKEVRPSERTYLNIIKLAKATERQAGESMDTITPFEIICNDYLAKPHEGREKLDLEDGFLPYYLQFKKVSCGMDVTDIIVKSLHKAFVPYMETKALNKETA